MSLTRPWVTVPHTCDKVPKICKKKLNICEISPQTDKQEIQTATLGPVTSEQVAGANVAARRYSRLVAGRHRENRCRSACDL